METMCKEREERERELKRDDALEEFGVCLEQLWHLILQRERSSNQTIDH
jgi:hypothetical protein